MSVGLLAVRLLHRFYVRVHFSKWFTLRFVFSRLFVSVRSFASQVGKGSFTPSLSQNRT